MRDVPNAPIRNAVAMYQSAPEVIALARLREDREWGEGNFAASEAYVANATKANEGVAQRLDRGLTRSIALAERDLRDVVAAIPGLIPPTDASTWLRVVMTGKVRSDDVDLVGIRTLALVAAARPHDHPGESRVTLVVASKGQNASSSVVDEPVRSMAEAVGMLEAIVRRPHVAAVALCIPLLLRSEAHDAFKLATARHFGTEHAPESVTLCVCATPDGGRVAVAAPAGRAVEGWREVPYANHGVVADAYEIRA